MYSLLLKAYINTLEAIRGLNKKKYKGLEVGETTDLF
jgi:hypothetical protein